ncbi:MAG: alpha-2-macroglobulin family protein [Rhizobiales bacterium]|nr:alpha-2-macroglobulin family protein [Hyphomicrobiales bacterium]OJY46487.1 MAG: alpha-2-macroglobulin [Rhizobiales bacterium 64-17]
MTPMMPAILRSSFALLLILWSALAAADDKPFQRSEFNDATTRLEEQIKKDAGQVTKTAPVLRREIDQAFQKNDIRGGMQLIGQLLTVAPDDAGAWLRLARTVLQIRPANDRERATLLDRASMAAYIAYQRSGGAEEADALAVLGRTLADRQMWRPALDAMRLSLEKREVADLRARYERVRLDHGFRILDYTVDSDASSPRACFQFSEDLPGKRTDFSPFVAVVGMEKPAVSVDEKQLCVEGLKHGERYEITLRAGLPSTVNEALPKSAPFTLYVRDRKPFARFASKAYVLPKAGQRGIPVASVNTTAVHIQIYRISDRNLIDAVMGRDFQRNLDRYELDRLGNERGYKVWEGELATEMKLNAEVTTAFPIDEAVGTLAPGVYAMAAVPTGPVANDYEEQATQWFVVSDLGLTALSGQDGINVFVHSLASASPREGVEVQLVSRANDVLAVKRTDRAGRAQFDAGLARGEGGSSPSLVIAREQNDYVFLNLKGPAFDLSDRGVGGRAAPAGLDAFVYTERGVYRSGETVHVTTLLRDAQGKAAPGTPLTLVMERPDGVDYRRTVAADQALGGRAWSVPLVASATSGTWRVKAYTDPKRPPVGQTTFMVEDYVPDRLEFALTTDAKELSQKDDTSFALDGHFLYGAPASGLDLEGEVVIQAAKERAGFAGYQFGLADEQITAVRQPLEDLPQTDDKGKADISVKLDTLPDATRPLEAQVMVRMAEAGGRAIERSVTLPVATTTAMIGVKPGFNGRSLGDGENATFDVVMIGADGQRRAASGLRYELLKIDTRYQWYKQNNSWQFEPVKTTQRVADGKVDVTANEPAKLSLPVRWGRYRLEVSGPDGLITTVPFDAGFYAEASADTPDLLEIALDKPDYRPGETMTVAVTARTAGQLTLNIVTDKLATSVSQEVKVGQATVKVPVAADWGTGAYVVATLRRPLDTQAQRMPGRAIGVQWFAIDRAAHTLTMEMPLPATIRPDTVLTVPVKLGGLRAGDQARVVVAAVDVGILNLTNYKPPAPDDYYLGQRRLTAELRDLYGQLIDGMQGARGAIRSGGDMAGADLAGSPPTQAPLALYSGLVTVGPDGTASIPFNIPAFAGTVRVMAVAFSADRVGKASGDVVVRDPVVATATLPRFLRIGDTSSFHLSLDNVEGVAGNYTVSVNAEGAASPSGDTTRTVTLNRGQRSGLSIPITAKQAGMTTLHLAVNGPDGFALARNYALETRPATTTLTRRTVRPLPKGESLIVSSDAFADLVPGTGRVDLSVGLSASLDAATLLQALDRYPYGCTEQIASRAVAMLYINDIAPPGRLALDRDGEERIRDAIERLLARQGANGSFGLWSVGGDDIWLDAYVTDFLSRARERKFAVPDESFQMAIDRLRNYVATAPEPKKNGGRELAYALYVLARNGAAPVGDLRYIADSQTGDLATPIAKAQIAAALGMLGDRIRAERVFAAALGAIPQQPVLQAGRSDFGSMLRDSAALVTLASEGNAPRATVEAAVQRVDSARGLASQLSTQEQAWLVLAARAIGKESGAITLDVAGRRQKGAFFQGLRPSDLAAPFKVTNTGDTDARAVLSVSGAPVMPEPAASRGFKIERLYYTLDGQPADIAKVTQNQRFAVVLRVTEAQPQFGRIIVADYLPAGFEIDNPRLVSSGETGKLNWIENAAEPVNAQFRDDRFTAAFTRSKDDKAVFTVAYVVRAVSPGRYVLPQAVVEDMYRPDRFGRTDTGTLEIGTTP